LLLATKGSGGAQAASSNAAPAIDPSKPARKTRTDATPHPHNRYSA
jgi:hypothetical protein